MRTPASPLLRAWSSLRASLPIQARRQRKSTASQKESSHNHVHQQQKSQHPNRHNSLSGVNGIRTSSTDITQQSHFLSSVSSAQADCSNSLNKPQKSCIREGLNGLSFSSFTHQRPSLPNNSQLPLSSSSRDCKVPISQPPGRPIIFSSSFIGFPAFDSWSLFDSSQQTMEARLSAPLASSLLSSTGSPSAPNATSECSAQFGSQTKSPISMNDSNNQSLILRPPPPMYRHSSQDPPLGVSDDIASSVSSFQRDPPTLIFPPPPILSPPSPPGVTNAYAQHATPPPRPTRPSHLVASQKSLHFISTLRTSSFQTSQPSDTSSNSTPDSHTNLQFVDSDNPEGTSESVVGDYIDHLTNEAIRLQQHSDEEDEDELNDNDSLLSTLSREAIAEQINTTLTRPPLISSRSDRPEPSELAIYPSDPKMSPDTFISSDKFSIQISGTACPDAPISLIQPRSTQDSFPKDFSFPEHCIPWSNSLTAPTSKPSQHLIDTCQPIVAMLGEEIRWSVPPEDDGGLLLTSCRLALLPRQQRQHESCGKANRQLVKSNPLSSSGATDLRISSPNTSTRNGDSNLASAPVVSGLHSSGLEQVRYWRSVATAARAEAAGQRSRAHSLAAELAHLRCDLDMAELEIGLLWQRLASSQADLADCHAVLTASLRLTQKKQQSLPIPISLSSALPQIKLAEAGLRPPQSKLWPEFEPSLSTRTLCNPSCNQSRGSQMLQTELPP